MAITKTATRDLTTAIAGAIWSRIKDSDNRRLEEEAGVDPAVKKARRDLDKEDPTETKVYDKDLRGLISKVFGRIDVQVSQTEGKVDNLSNKVSAVGGEIVNTQQMIINQNEMLEAKFDELLEVLGIKNDQDDDNKAQKDFEQLELELDQVVSGGSGSTRGISKSGKGSESYSGLVNWFKVKSYEMMHRVVRRAWKSRFFRKPRALYRLGRKKIFDVITSAAATRTGSAILPQILRGKAGQRLLQTALGRGAGRLVPIASTALAADDVARYQKKGDWLGMSLAFIDMVASGTEGAYGTGVGAPVGAVASVIANIAGGALTAYEIAQILMGGDPYSTKGILPFETGTAKQPSFGGIISATSPIVSVVRTFGEKSGHGGQVEALISQANLSDTPAVDVSHSFTVGGGVSGATSIDPASIVGKAPEIMSPRRKEEEKPDITDENSDDSTVSRERRDTGGNNQWWDFLDLFPNEVEGGSVQPTETIMGGAVVTQRNDPDAEQTGIDVALKNPETGGFDVGAPIMNPFEELTITDSGFQGSGEGETGRGYGKWVTGQALVDGKKYELLVAHLDTISVNKGDVIQGGDIIGTQGITGRATGPHVSTHINALDGGNPQDILNRVENSWVNGGEISTDSLNRTKENNDSLKPTDTISSLNTVESPVPNIVSEGSMNRQLLATDSKRSNIVILNNQVIKTSNLTVPIGSQSESGDFFPAYNLARLG